MKTTNGYIYSFSRKNKKYTFNKENQLAITAVLAKASDTMINPVAGHFVLYVNYSFNIKRMIPKVRRLFKEKNNRDFMFMYSIEQTEAQKKYNTVHIHLWVVADIPNSSDANELFEIDLIKDLSTLKNINNDFTYPERNITQRIRDSA